VGYLLGILNRRLGLHVRHLNRQIRSTLFAQAALRIPALLDAHPLAAAWALAEVRLDLLDCFGVRSIVSTFPCCRVYVTSDICRATQEAPEQATSHIQGFASNASA